MTGLEYPRRCCWLLGWPSKGFLHPQGRAVRWCRTQNGDGTWKVPLSGQSDPPFPSQNARFSTSQPEVTSNCNLCLQGSALLVDVAVSPGWGWMAPLVFLMPIWALSTCLLRGGQGARQGAKVRGRKWGF
jgi:hypothetical protein